MEVIEILTYGLIYTVKFGKFARRESLTNLYSSGKF